MPYTELPNSSFMDFASWRSGASAPTGGPVDHQLHAQCRAHPRPGQRSVDPAQRQLGVAPATTRYPERQRHAVVDLRRRHGEVQSGEGRARRAWASRRSSRWRPSRACQSGYISSAESRTIWVQVDARPTSTSLFGPQASDGLHGAWQRNWHWDGQPLAARRLGQHARRQGPVVRHAPTSSRCCPIPATARWCPCRRAGRAWATPRTSPTDIFPQQIADDYYNFPLSGDSGIPPRALHRRPARSAWSSRASAPRCWATTRATASRRRSTPIVRTAGVARPGAMGDLG